ncbi:GTPase HflX [Flammeovirga kamogawensis]|uniref:GTPase HflX n=1 Tax=Flammeovirga kamogawensis TaxID=373891 RepID=A0ABX8GZX8_9BACT|nr:GTPase HflX [Flammeovirga kamogawensis]MBB6459570.1 GTP-binding protein HflX [Flammeovirga kamogawensis]QWG09120.1 GTPase HflX [Flammeovirga kamogawensis]TRX67408.1 GTPase HflX [Flammeovirga kamogawensis]
MKKEFHHTKDNKAPRAVLIGLALKDQTVEKAQEYLDELAFLASTLGIETVKTFIQRLDTPDKKTFVGKGKLEEILTFVQAEGIDTIIFDDDLSSAHARNLDREVEDLMIIDRSLLILQIFAMRAKSSQAITQVELAQYQYMLPRLTNLWTHHSRQRGGVGMKGPGETELETDKRIIRDKISLLRKKLKKIETQSDLRRKGRDKQVRVALVGYTNVGKSTIMKRLSKADVFAENKLFATVDSTVRKITMNNVPFLMTDTVGFIRKLPTTLIESFKSTLDEIVEADILIHVVDVSHESFEEHVDVVNKTLVEIKATDKPTLLVFNKVDNFVDKEYPPFEDHPPATLAEWKESYLAKDNNSIFISAAKEEGIEELKLKIFELVSDKFYKIYPNHHSFAYNQLWMNQGGDWAEKFGEASDTEEDED